MVNSTKRPISNRPKTLKKKRDEEECQLMNGLASTSRYKNQNQAKQDSSIDAFGVTKTLLKHCQNSTLNEKHGSILNP